MVDNPTAYRWIFLPDASGTLVVAASPPLYVDQFGTVSLLESSITSVGTLNAGSLARGFGKTPGSASHRDHNVTDKLFLSITLFRFFVKQNVGDSLQESALLDRRATVKTLPGRRRRLSDQFYHAAQSSTHRTL